MYKFVKLSDICDFQSGLWKGKKEPFTKANVIRNTNFRPEGILSYENISLLDVETKQLSNRKLEHGDIILEKSGGGEKTPVGRVCLFEKQSSLIPYSLSNFTSLIRIKDPSKLYYKYLHKFLHFVYAVGRTETMQRNSTGIRNLQLKDYKNICIPIPNIKDQYEIVNALEEITTGIDKAIFVNEKKNYQLDMFYFSFINAELFSENKVNIVKLGDISKIKGGKRLPKGEKLLGSKTKYPYIRVADFNDTGTINLTTVKYISEDIYNQISRYTISTKDVYVSIAGTIGKTGIIPKSLNNANLTENAAKIILNDNCERDYFYYFTTSKSFKDQAINQTRTAAQPKLALERLGQVKLPLPSITNQRLKINKIKTIKKLIESIKDKTIEKIGNYKNLKLAIFDKKLNIKET
jgi:type I restriction enzyme, S subunit